MKGLKGICYFTTYIVFIVLYSCISKTNKDSSKKPLTLPNILFCIADDASMKSFGAYGDTFIDTPNIDDLASKGLVFNNAYNCNPKCSPARACIVTGMYSWQLQEATNHWPKFPDQFKFYPHILMEKGYSVGFTGKGWGPGEYSTTHNPAGPAYNTLKLKPPFTGISNIDYAGNFEDFLTKTVDTPSSPFCFWLGTKEPHRKYEKDSWKASGKELEQAHVPAFYPNSDIVKGDILDYAIEVEWFDTHVGKAITSLEKRGLLNNTIVIITSDHGMPFPRVKGQIYEEGFHVPLIVYWKGQVISGRTVDDFVSFPDLAPTFLELLGMQPDAQMTGKSFANIIKSEESGQIDTSRDHVLLCKERHDIGRADDAGVNLGYPVRAIRNHEYLYVHNFKPERWPVGNPEFGLLNCDGSPTKTFIVGLEKDQKQNHFYQLNFGKRTEEELYDIIKDPDCINNLALLSDYATIRKDLRAQMEKEFIEKGDPRALGNGDVFDSYPYYGRAYDYVNKKRLAKPLN